MGNSKTGAIERKAFIFNVQKYNVYDGPGVRTIVFFKGCPLRCKWCANPEGWEKKYQIMYKKSLCVDCGACVSVCPVGIHNFSPQDGKHEINRKLECVGCGKCVEACPQTALALAGEAKTISELLQVVQEDQAFYDMSGGGITLGGGEVLMQPEAAANLLAACKQEGINTAIETCGYAKLETLLRVGEFTDLFLYDIKHIDSERHYALTGVRNELILSNLQELLARRYNVVVRLPLLKGINDRQEDIVRLIDFLRPYRDYKNFKGVDLLPYHKLGVHKYEQLDLDYPLTEDPSLSSDEMVRIEDLFKECGFSVKIVNH